jgi:tripartite-type tricarboxylate transporter receptor subunit TctC
MLRSAMAAALVLAFASEPASADPVADFYKGKQIKFIIRAGVGGTYDLYARLLGRHIGAHIPGNPTILPINMSGGGGIKAAMYVAEVAPKDGTILTIVSQGLATDQGLGLNPSFQADLREFNWVGNMSSAGQVVVTWHTSPTRTLDDAMTRATVIGVTGAGSISVQLGAVLNNVIGTKFKLVVGYPDGNDVNLAMERGEVEGRCSSPWPSYLAATPHYVHDKLITPIVQVGLEKEPDLQNVPLLRDLAKTAQERQILDFMSQAVAIGRPIATTPGVPAERVAALRKAFDEALRDPAFTADAERQRLEIRAMSGVELAGLVRQVIETPPDLRERVKLAIQPKNAPSLRAPSRATNKREMDELPGPDLQRRPRHRDHHSQSPDTHERAFAQSRRGAASRLRRGGRRSSGAGDHPDRER